MTGLLSFDSFECVDSVLATIEQQQSRLEALYRLDCLIRGPRTVIAFGYRFLSLVYLLLGLTCPGAQSAVSRFHVLHYELIKLMMMTIVTFMIYHYSSYSDY